MNRFSTNEVCEALGIKYQRLREWIDRGYVVPTWRAEGSGNRTAFSRQEVYLVALFMHLILVEGFDRGLAGERVAAVGKYLGAARTWDNADDGAYLIFSRMPSTADGQKSKSVSALLAEVSRSGQPGVQIVNEGALKEQSMFEILSYKGFYQRWSDFESLTIVNFKRVRELVDTRLR